MQNSTEKKFDVMPEKFGMILVGAGSTFREFLA
jgi:hypothetical protein